MCMFGLEIRIAVFWQTDWMSFTKHSSTISFQSKGSNPKDKLITFFCKPNLLKEVTIICINEKNAQS